MAAKFHRDLKAALVAGRKKKTAVAEETEESSVAEEREEAPVAEETEAHDGLDQSDPGVEVTADSAAANGPDGEGHVETDGDEDEGGRSGEEDETENNDGTPRESPLDFLLSPPSPPVSSPAASDARPLSTIVWSVAPDDTPPKNQQEPSSEEENEEGGDEEARSPIVAEITADVSPTPSPSDSRCPSAVSPTVADEAARSSSPPKNYMCDGCCNTFSGVDAMLDHFENDCHQGANNNDGEAG
jgi:hypothetical protein